MASVFTFWDDLYEDSENVAFAAAFAAASVPATIGKVCAISAHQPPPLADAVGLWRDQSAAL